MMSWRLVPYPERAADSRGEKRNPDGYLPRQRSAFARLRGRVLCWSGGMPSTTKVEKVRELSQRLTTADAAVFTGYRGLTVQDTGDLRATLAEVQTRFAVVKNTLARLALNEAGMDGLEPMVEGPTAIAFVSGDPVTAAKRLLDASRRFPVLELKGGYAEGRVLSAEQVRALATLESREMMLARLAGLAKSQMSRTAWLFQALQARFVSLLEAYREKLPAETGADEETEGGGS